MKKISVKDLTVSFKTNQGLVRAVRGVSFDLKEGETLAIVGESGSGKSVSTRAIMGILAGNAIIDKGSIEYEGEDLTKISESQFHRIRGRKIGMIFQDPLSSLNPIMKIGKQITEGMLINGKHLKNKVKELSHNSKIDYEKSLEEYKNKKIEIKDEKDPTKKMELKSELNVKLLEIKELKRISVNEYKSAKKQVNEEYVIEKEKFLRKKSELNDQILTYKIADKENQTDSSDLIKELKEKIKIERELFKRYVKVTKKEAYEQAIKIMTEVGIPDPIKRFKQYPFQFSGGMRQRIVIAIALTANPDVLICDEPTTALDVTIQSQILELIQEIKEERNLSVIFITHDLGVVANIADRVAVMYAGKIVEYGNVDEIFYNPKHPYTWALLSSMPDLESKDRLIAIPGTPPDMLYPPVGDAFALRSEYALEIDFKEEPPFFKVSETHYAATWLLDKRAPKVELPTPIKSRIEKFEMIQKEEGGLK